MKGMARFSVADLLLAVFYFAIASAVMSALTFEVGSPPELLVLALVGLSGAMIGAGCGVLVGHPASCALAGFLLFAIPVIALASMTLI
jgi:hypothetical protein